jgi:hypothetical protein
MSDLTHAPGSNVTRLHTILLPGMVPAPNDPLGEC